MSVGERLDRDYKKMMLIQTKSDVDNNLSWSDYIEFLLKYMQIGVL